ncbi:hypothetical protein BUALT_Bualt09G0072600 [Buddleja alternifolia]|uniref:Uncharacterized protein n=1 Tax=Buddleja alternifolia TaxID=168488 RepID=A0AAV6X010_9LAMI|nr:hypothetical protein BUALT_Bualt09G0072600 [Buddleja alternifolia]
MKALSKPLSSPSRSEKFPPPLLRFLRSNVGSRSRGRSRSSPMFYMRTRKTAQAVIGATQEPSSPKVTCIGQVRVRRAAKKTSTASAAVKSRRRWWRLKKPLFCGKIRFRSRKRPFRKIFRNWCLFFRFGYCKKVDVAEDSFRVNSNQKNEITVGKNRISCSSNCSEDDCRSDKHENVVLESSSSTATPPKNALMLTRCRSAPYRSSSLGGRFWGSPLAEEESENEAGNERKTEEELKKPRISEESSKESEKSVNDVEELKGTAGNALHPLILTRCKSEPARTGERLLNPEVMQRRLDVVEPCSR